MTQLPTMRPMWCDDFDMDLPKVIPDAAEIVGDLGDILLWTAGKADERGMLNHPSVWNHDLGMIAFFGFRSPSKPEVFWSGGGEVRCTFWEALRDCWSHHFVMLVERRPIWDSCALWPTYEAILWNVRGWGDGKVAQAEVARPEARASLERAVEAFRAITLTPQFAGRIERLAPAETRA